MSKSCKSCIFFQEFEKRPDEPTSQGCTQPNWAGYVDVEFPACGGIAYTGMPHGQTWICQWCGKELPDSYPYCDCERRE